MKIPLSLIKQFLPLQLSVQEIADQLTLLGLEVERIENEQPTYSGVVVGQIESVKRHPQADKLLLLKVTDGKESFDIVCGDTTCEANLKVAFAKVGAKLKDEKGKDFKIQKAKLRGVESFGMLCAADELGIFEDASGILRLDPDFELGADVSELLWDPVFDISLTPNLGHCMSALGVARELAAFMNKKINLPDSVKAKSLEGWDVSIENRELCPRYACALIENVTVAPSPFWLQMRLGMCGIRSINNIVDVTNLVMLEMGQPMHAFDADKIHGKKIRVGTAKGTKKISLLDDTERDAPEESLFIQDSKGPIALAGIMGGSESAVSDQTKDILLEAAFLNPLTVRKTATKLGLRTESSIRFEKGTDPNLVPIAIERARSLIAELSSQSSFIGIIDEKAADFLPKEIHLRVPRVQKILGHHFSLSEVDVIFHKLGFKTKTLSKDALQVAVPTFRSDISEEIDLIEEVARIYGYNHIPEVIPKFTSAKLPHNPLFHFENLIRTRLIAEGLQEILTCDLISPKLAEITKELSHPKGSLVQVQHSKSNEHSILRPSLLAGMLETQAFNQGRKISDLSLFEIGRIHLRVGEEFIEQETVAILLSGKESPHSWDRPAHAVDFFTLKGIVENLLAALRLTDVGFKPSKHPSFHPTNQANIMVKDADIGVIGELHPETLDLLDIKQKTFFCELNLYHLLKLHPKKISLEEIPAFPSSERDWTVTLDDSFEISRILESAKAFSSPLLEKIELLDLFKGKSVPEGKKNATFRFTYRNRKKTVSFDDVEKEHMKVISSIMPK